MLDLAVQHIKGLQNEVQVRKYVMLSDYYYAFFGIEIWFFEDPQFRLL